MVKSRVTMLGMLAGLNTEPIQYHLKTLRSLVRDLQPDFIGINADDWQARDLSAASPEYREVLVPFSRQTDIVIVSYHQL